MYTVNMGLRDRGKLALLRQGRGLIRRRRLRHLRHHVPRVQGLYICTHLQRQRQCRTSPLRLIARCLNGYGFGMSCRHVAGGDILHEHKTPRIRDGEKTRCVRPVEGWPPPKPVTGRASPARMCIYMYVYIYIYTYVY